MSATDQKIDAEPIMPEPIPDFANYGYMDLQGVCNARDLGGLPAAHGKRIKKRRLMRSGDLHNATAGDMKQLMSMHELDCVLDFRTPDEAQEKPDPMPLMTGVEYVSLPVLPESVISTIGRAAFGKDMRIAREFVSHPFETIQDLYPKALMGELGINAYKRFLHMLLETEEGGTLWHCTQGKDRTGVGAILVEYCLGVPMDLIRQDYLATNLFTNGWLERVSQFLHEKGIAKGFDADVEAYAYAHLFYFEAAMDVLNSVFGSIDSYLEKQLDFGPDKQKKLQELYLE